VYQVIPAILEIDFLEIERKIESLQAVSDYFHIDFIDGVFAANKTFLDPTPFAKFTKGNFLEAHLMVSDPIKYLDPLANAGFKRFIGQIEMMADQVAFVASGERLGEVGLALDGKTPLDKLLAPLDDLDILLFMTIDAGFSGQKFNPSYIEKIKSLVPNFVNIEVDGGINDRTIQIARQCGGNIFTSDSFLFQSKDPVKAYLKLKEKVLETQGEQIGS